MLPRWLTALPRFAATWRDEILVIALGFAYQAGVSGSLGAPRTHEAEQVVVRIAAEQPRTVVEARVTTEGTVTSSPRMRTPAATTGRGCSAAMRTTTCSRS